MSKLDLQKIFDDLRKSAVKRSPEILTGIGIAGMITTTIMAVKATPKALDLIAEIKEKHKNDEDKKAEAKDMVKKVAPVYIPSAVVCLMSTSCIVGASSINFKRNAALATAYSISENALREYQSKVIESIGPKKERQIRDDICKDKLEKNPVVNTEVIVTGDGDTLFYDTVTGRHFRSSIQKIKKIENDLNKRLMNEMYISLNEVMYEFGLRPTSQGNELGFNIDDGLIDFTFSAQINEEDQPVIVLDYIVAPRFGYGDLH